MMAGASYGQTTRGISDSRAVAERGPHHRVWAHETYETNHIGEVSTQDVAIVEIATGMHFFDGTNWREAHPKIRITEAGGLGTETAHKVAFAANLNTIGAVTLVTPDGLTMRSRVAGISYSDTGSGKAVMVAVTKDSDGLVIGESEVLYTNAFDTVEADVQYLYTLAGLEQNIVWREEPPSPELLDLNPKTTWIQVVTEFSESPEPVVKTGANGFEETLKFGEMVIGQGRAFAVGDAAEGQTSIAVGKQWVNLGGRRFLVESVPYPEVVAQLRALGRKKDGAAIPVERRGQGQSLTAVLQSVLPHPGRSRKSGKMMLAQADVKPRPGFVLDYTTLGNQSDFTFAANTNYYVSGLVNLSGTTTIEGGTIIKFTNHTSAKISMSGPLVCKTEQYRPAVLTSKDDNTVGEAITGSTGNPTNYNGGTYLYSSVLDTTNAIQYLRLSYAGTGLAFDGLTNGVWHCQFLKCNNGIDSYNQKEVRLYNVLLAVSSNCIVNSTNLRGQHLTVDVCSNLVSAASGSLALTNSILTAVGTVGVASPTYEQVTTATSGSGIYQTVGAASYYLADSSTNRDAGGTGLDVALANDLKLRTTYPPVVIATNLTNPTVLSSRAARDTDSPDLGYHYDPLDYVVFNTTVDANLVLTNGVVLGTYGTLPQCGLSLNSGNFIAEGTPSKLNWIARYNTVQEQSSTNWSGSTVGYSIRLYSSNLPVQVRFTGWSLLGGSGIHFYDNSDGTIPSAFVHCRFSGGNITVDPGAIAFTNCLLERTYTKLQDDFDYGRSWYLYNNLLFGGTLYYRAKGDGPDLQAHDNLLDRTVITKGPQSASFTHDYNGYVTNQNRLTPNGAHDKILTNNPVYLTSYLGRYYYPTNDGMLSFLINAGSRNADAATLYHFTTTDNQVGGVQIKETNSVVDIGYHYVATDGAGNPIDTNGNGNPDYSEDSSGVGAPIFTVSLVAPANNAVFAQPATIGLVAIVTSWSSMVTNVAILRSNTCVTQLASSPYQFTWPLVTLGQYSLTARAYDQAGLSCTSAPVNISVTNACGSTY